MSRVSAGPVDRPRPALVHEVALPVLAVALIVGYADIRIPMGLPGHRGLVWLTLLVAVALTTQRAATVVAVGAASTIGTIGTVGTIGLHAPSGGAGCLRYLAAAILLYAVAAAPVARHHRWLVAVAAAPIHLVAMADSVGVLLGRRDLLFSGGMAEKALFHVGFGLAAGLLGWAIASGIGRVNGKDYAP